MGRWSEIGTFWLVVAEISDICWARVGMKVGLEYVYLKYPPQTFYVNDKLNVLGTYEWVRCLFQGLFLISLCNDTCRSFFFFNI